MAPAIAAAMHYYYSSASNSTFGCWVDAATTTMDSSLAFNCSASWHCHHHRRHPSFSLGHPKTIAAAFNSTNTECDSTDSGLAAVLAVARVGCHSTYKDH